MFEKKIRDYLQAQRYITVVKSYLRPVVLSDSKGVYLKDQVSHPEDRQLAGGTKKPNVSKGFLVDKVDGHLGLTKDEEKSLNHSKLTKEAEKGGKPRTNLYELYINEIQSMQLEFLVLEEKLKKEEDSLKKLNNEKQLAIDHYTQQVQRRDSEIQRRFTFIRLRVKELAFTKLTKEFSELKADVERKKRKEDDDVSESITVFPGGKPLESSSVEMPEKTAETCVQLTEAGMEALICVEELNCPSLSHVFVSECINQVLQRSLVARRHTGLLLHDLVKKSIITDKQYVQGLNSVLVYTEDMTIFIPKLYQYFGELIGLMVQDGSVPLSFLKESCQPLMESGQAGNLVAKILHDVSDREDNEKVRYLWRKSGLEWSDFVPEDQITQFLKEKQLEYTIREDITTTTPTVRMTLAKIKDNLHDLLEDNPARNEEIFDWIEADLDDFTTKDKKFIRALMTAVCSSAILISEATRPQVVENQDDDDFLSGFQHFRRIRDSRAGSSRKKKKTMYSIKVTCLDRPQYQTINPTIVKAMNGKLLVACRAGWSLTSNICYIQTTQTVTCNEAQSGYISVSLIYQQSCLDLEGITAEFYSTEEMDDA
ncbi:EIF4G [Mytilus edulis]|uniref:EIF4G n=1 Tax=Mytilus edulis TaxID=6550 RepID=A0A8S3PNE5_MYTED|nr:EIF4G [Mytilus edulis]